MSTPKEKVEQQVDSNQQESQEPTVEKQSKGKEKKKKKKKKKKNTEVTPIVQPSQETLQLAKLNEEQLKEEAKKPRLFWDTQPVLKLSEEAKKIGPIEVKKLEDVRKEPYDLHPEFEWYEIDQANDEEMQEIYTLLEQNYVEDDDAMFRFAYPIEFLRWALTPPNWKKVWHLAVRTKKTKKFVAFISAIPGKFELRKAGVVKQLNMVEINFLCVHKKLRSKRLAPQLIREITRRVNLTDCWQAIYTAGVLIPKPISTTRYYHRSLNPSKLIAIGFSRIPKRFERFKNPLEMTERYYKLPDTPQIPGFREMKKSDVGQVLNQLQKFLRQFSIAPQFTKQEFIHWFLPRDGVINSYVVEDPETKKITEFGSFYTLPSTIIGDTKYKLLKAAYLFYYFYTKHSVVDLVRDLLIVAKQKDFDVFNCLDILHNQQLFTELKFGIGDGNLHYYLYNYECPTLRPEEMGVVML